MRFKNWFFTEDATRPAQQRGLYPPAYGVPDFYPPCAVINWSADAITYMSAKDRKLKVIWGKGILGKFPGYKSN